MDADLTHDTEAWLLNMNKEKSHPGITTVASFSFHEAGWKTKLYFRSMKTEGSSVNTLHKFVCCDS